MQIGYCTDQPSVTVQYDFIESWDICSTVVGQPLAASFVLSDLPGSEITGTVACWIVDVDLGGLAFTMAADGDGTHAPSDFLEWFGVSVRFPSLVGTQTGVLLGDYPTCSHWDGTIWDPIPNSAEAGTGMGTIDDVRIDGPIFPGCYYTQPNDIYLKLVSQSPCGTGFGQKLCFSRSSWTACPCNNNGILGNGCWNSSNFDGAWLNSSGSVSPDTVVLHAGGMRPTALNIFIQGNADISPGLIFGDGIRCLGGSIKRIGVKTASGGASQYPETGDPSVSQRSAATGDPLVPGAVRYYQTYYRDPYSGFCTAATFNVTSGVRIVW